MLRSRLPTAVRSLWKRPTHTAVNVSGLAIGLAACLVIGLYAHHEWSYNRFHEKADRIYRLVQTKSRTAAQKTAVTPPLAGPALEKEYPGVEETTRLVRQTLTVRRGTEAFEGQRVLTADDGFFNVFTFLLRHGDPGGALVEPYSVVLAAPAARRHFGSAAEAMGRTLSINDGGAFEEYTVTGVTAPVPDNSQIQFDAITSFATVEAMRPQLLNWGVSAFWTFALLEEETQARALEGQLDGFVRRHLGEEGKHTTYSLQALEDMYLGPDLAMELVPTGNAEVVYALAAIALFILLLAAINFVNLSTAAATDRATEVGVRKSLGAQRSGLVGQFLSESVVVALCGGVCALLLAWGAATVLRGSLPGLEIAYDELLSGTTLFALLCATLGTGLLAGAYPALVMSGFSPSRALRGGGMEASGRGRFRKGLTVFQFTVAIALLAVTGVAIQQLRYASEKDLGYDAERLLAVDISGGMQQANLLAGEWADLAGVESVAAATRAPVQISTTQPLKRSQGQRPEVSARVFNVGPRFVRTARMKLLAGQDFPPGALADSTQTVLINETAARGLGWENPQDAVGQSVHIRGADRQVAGVIGDFHYESMHQSIRPLVLFSRPEPIGSVLVRLGPEQTGPALDALESSWQEITGAASEDFSYSFVEEQVARLYRDDRELGRMLGVFAGLAVAVACFGFYGLSAYTTRRRRKEVGVRKAMGASALSIVTLLSKEYAKLVALSFVLAVPIAWYAAGQWLERFAYRINLGPWVFLAAGALAAIVALLTVGVHTLRAATANPAWALRDE